MPDEHGRQMCSGCSWAPCSQRDIVRCVKSPPKLCGALAGGVPQPERHLRTGDMHLCVAPLEPHGLRAGLLPVGVVGDGQAESSWVLPLRGTGQAGAAGSPRGQGGRWAGGAPTSRPTACGARGDQLLPNGAPAVPRRGQRVAKERGSFAIAEVGVTGRLQ